MTDIVDKETRSRIMRSIRSSSTKPEISLRHRLHALGLRYVLGGRKLPGRPDLVFPSRRTAVFVHGCFWHRHEGCSRATTPKSNLEYWIPKFERNVERDREAEAALASAGWRFAVVWECELTPKKADETAKRISEWIREREPD